MPRRKRENATFREGLGPSPAYASRTGWLTARGFHLLRFRNHELDDDIHGVVIHRAVEAIQRALATRADV